MKEFAVALSAMTASHHQVADKTTQAGADRAVGPDSAPLH